MYLRILECNDSACLFVSVLYCFIPKFAQSLKESTDYAVSVTAVLNWTMFRMLVYTNHTASWLDGKMALGIKTSITMYREAETRRDLLNPPARSTHERFLKDQWG